MRKVNVRWDKVVMIRHDDPFLVHTNVVVLHSAILSFLCSLERLLLFLLYALTSGKRGSVEVGGKKESEVVFFLRRDPKV